MSQTEWKTWHEAYQDPQSGISRRLVHVQNRFRDALDDQPPGPIQVISLCAGEGRDVLGVLPHHRRRDDVTARLIELDPDIAAVARSTAAARGLNRVEVIAGDAGSLDESIDLAPADVVLICGIFGNVSDADILRTIQGVRTLSRNGATVLWTRHRNPPDVTPTIRQWFDDEEFDQIGFDYEDGHSFSVGAERYRGQPQSAVPTARLFTFLPRGRSIPDR